MASVVEICNKALSLLGKKSITSLDDLTPEAIACRAHWPTLRDSILREHPWNCALERVVFNRLIETPAYGFAYYYQLPANTLHVFEVEPEQFFEVEGRKILADSPKLSGRVVYSQTDSSQYDPQLSLAYSYLLAGELAYPMTSSSSLGDKYTKEGRDLLSMAKASDALEGRQQNKRNQGWLKAKLGGR